MFTLGQIEELHSRLGSTEAPAEYVKALKAVGVEKYGSYLTDGHSEYPGMGGHRVLSPPAHEKFSVAEQGKSEAFLEHLKLHGQGKTTYLEMSRGLAESGVEKWTVDAVHMTVTYYDRAENEMLVEQIE